MKFEVGAIVRQYHDSGRRRYDDAEVTCVHGNGALDVLLNGRSCGWSEWACEVVRKPPTSSDVAAMKAAFEAKYQRDWNDPANAEMKAVWADAWVAARIPTDALLEESLSQITDKPWDDETLLHARISELLGVEVKYPDLVDQIRAERA